MEQFNRIEYNMSDFYIETLEKELPQLKNNPKVLIFSL